MHKRPWPEVLLFPRFTFTFSTSQSNKGLVISVVLFDSECRTLRKSTLPELAGLRAFQIFQEAAKSMLANCWSFEAHKFGKDALERSKLRQGLEEKCV